MRVFSVSCVRFTALLCAISFLGKAQNPLFSEAFKEFSESRLWSYEEIAVDWKMKPSLQADFNEAWNNLIEDNAPAAEAGFTDVLKKDSLFWQAYYFRGAARKKLQNLRLAETDLRHALRLHRDSYEGHVELAKVLHLQRKFDESERMIAKATRIDRTKPVAYYLRGDINLNQSQPRAAVTNYKDCLRVDSMFHDARIMLALLDLVEKRNVMPALSHLDRVLAYDSLQKTALLFRAILAYDKNKEQCVRDLTNLLMVSPNHLMALYIRGVYNTELSQFSQAFSDFHKVLKGTETNDNNFKGKQTWVDKKIDLQNAGAYTVTRVYGIEEDDAIKLQQAYCLILTEKFDDAITVASKVKDHRKEPLAMYLLAVAHEHKGKHNDALVYYSRALALDNDIADAHKKRAIYSQELKEWRQSVNDLDEVLRLTPENYVIYKIRGVSNYYLEDYEKSVHDFTRYIEYDSADMEIVSYRGMAYLKNNQHLLGYIDLAVSKNTDMIEMPKAKLLADSVLIKGDTTLALSFLDKMTAAIPSFTEGWVLKFKIQLARNNWKSVQAEINRALRYRRSDAPKPDHSFLLTLGGIQHADNRHDKDAEKMFDEAIKVDASNSLAYLHRGKLLLAQGKASKAQNDLEKASSLGDAEAIRVLNSLKR